MLRHFSWTVTVGIRRPWSVRVSVNTYRPCGYEVRRAGPHFRIVHAGLDTICVTVVGTAVRGEQGP